MKEGGQSIIGKGHVVNEGTVMGKSLQDDDFRGKCKKKQGRAKGDRRG